MLSLELKINNEITSHYPEIENQFSKHFPNISFDKVKNQLTWFVNEDEVNRGIHRLHCFLQILDDKNKISELKIFSDIDPEKKEEFFALFSNLNQEKKEALLALLLIDSCKCSQNAISAFSATGNKPLKDSVPFFFDTLKKAPHIYPIFEAISSEAQKYIRNHIFYLHQRHLQLGEIPISGLHEFARLLEEKDEDQLIDCLQLQNLFWTINLTAFDLSVFKQIKQNQRKNELGPTMKPEFLDQLQNIQTCLKECIQKKSLEPLTHYYIKVIPDLAKEKLEKCNSQTQVFIGRLMMLLLSKIAKNESENTLIELMSNAANLTLISETAKEEAQCFADLELQAITFLPAVFWKLQEINTESKSNADILLIYIKLQQSLYKSLPQIKDSLQGNRSIPLFSISQDIEFLQNYSRHSDYKLMVKLTVGQQFITLSPRLVAPEAVLNTKHESRDTFTEKPQYDSSSAYPFNKG